MPHNLTLRAALAAVALTAAALTAANPTEPASTAFSPRHGDVLTVHRTSPLLPGPAAATNGEEAAEAPLTWDFSQAEIEEPNIEWHYWCRDTFFSETRPHIRRDYIVNGDTTRLFCTETWCRRIAHDFVTAPYTPNSLAEGSMQRFDEHGRQYTTDSIRGDARATVSLSKAGRLILPGDIDLDGVVMVSRTYESVRRLSPAHSRYDSLTATAPWHHTEKVITWHAPGLRYAVAETRIVSDSVAGYQALKAVESHIAPPETQPLESSEQNLLYAARPASATPQLSAAPGSGDAADSTTGDDTAGGWPRELTDLTASADGESIAVGFTAPASGEVGFLLCDIAGRVYSRLEPRAVEGSERVDVALPRPESLAPGDYLLQVVTPGGITTRKLLLR